MLNRIDDRYCHRLLALFLLLLAPGTHLTWGQVPPGLGYVYPPVVVRGESTDVQLGGYDFTADMQWFVHDDQVTLEITGSPGPYHLPPPPYWVGPRASTTAMPIPREVPGCLSVLANHPPGLVRWQVANANGSSESAVFYVSDGPEIIESRSRDLPQTLPNSPIAVSGRLSRLTEVDHYQWTANHTGPVTVQLMARQLGSPLNGVIQIRDAAGRLLADFADTQGRDGSVTFLARSGDSYDISLHDVDFRGDRAFVYRLALSHGPSVNVIMPAYGKRGASQEMMFVGPGLATGADQFETIRQAVSFPSQSDSTVYRHRLSTYFGDVDVAIPLSDTDEVIPTETIGAETPLALETPRAVTRVMSPDVDDHRYQWQVQPDEMWSIDLQSMLVGGCLDVELEILGPSGSQVAANDDQPGSPDAALRFKAAEAGLHTCIVRSTTPRTGRPDEFYRLHIRREAPDYRLTVPQQINLPSGRSVEVNVAVERFGGFDQEISISVDPLPDGVTLEGTTTNPNGANETKVVFKSAPDAAVVASVISFRGTAKEADTEMVRMATATAAGNLCPRSPRDNRISRVLLAMTMPPPFEILVVDRERQRDVHRGTHYLAELEVVRQETFDGPLQIVMSARQSRDRQGIRGGIVDVPANDHRLMYPCFMPEWLGTDLTRRMVVHGVGSIADPQGNMRYVTKAGGSRITMIMEGALLKLDTPTADVVVRCGESCEIPVIVSRSAKLPMVTTIELTVPEELAGRLQAAPLVLPPGVDRGILRIDSTADGDLEELRRLAGPWRLRMTATALQDERWPVISEAEVTVDLVTP